MPSPCTALHCGLLPQLPSACNQHLSSCSQHSSTTTNRFCYTSESSSDAFNNIVHMWSWTFPRVQEQFWPYDLVLTAQQWSTWHAVWQTWTWPQHQHNKWLSMTFETWITRHSIPLKVALLAAWVCMSTDNHALIPTMLPMTLTADSGEWEWNPGWLYCSPSP